MALWATVPVLLTGVGARALRWAFVHAGRAADIERIQVLESRLDDLSKSPGSSTADQPPGRLQRRSMIVVSPVA
jgi:hypothetical protein